jgi:redox-sensitive bicupin YhaK (pirin superfamily)
MTAGHGIAHSERSIHSGADLHGIQLWVALPDAERDRSPMFRHHRDLPTFAIDAASARLFVGDFGGHHAGVEVFTPLLGLELVIPAGRTVQIPLDRSFEHGLHVAAGSIRVQEESTPSGSLLFVPAGTEEITLTAPKGAVIALLGGEPFDEPMVMWWNFIGCTHEEVEEMQRDWNAHSDRFPAFTDAIGGRIDAPPMPNVRLKARRNDLT